MSYRVFIVLGVADRERLSVLQSYRFALDLTPRQERAVLAHAGAARVAHNWALARVKAVMHQRAAERSYGVPDEHLTPTIGWSLPALRRSWNAAKADVAPWWTECSKEAFNTGLDALARALKNWSDSRSGKRAGCRVGVPPVQVPAPVDAIGAVHYRGHPRGAGPQACGVASAGPVEVARVGS